MKSLAVFGAARNRHKTIGVIAPGFDSSFVVEAVKGIRNAAAAGGYDTLMAHSRGNIQKEMAGIRLLPDEAAAVFFGPQAGLRGSIVIIDHARCGYLAAEHLIQRGCRHPVLITGTLMTNACGLRYDGFCAALREYAPGRRTPGLLMAPIDTETDIAQVIQRLLRLAPRPDGLFVTDNRSAAMCIHMLEDAGVKVPGDIAIIGLDDEAIGRLIAPALTCIAQPAFELGRTAASLLVDRLARAAGQKASGQKATVQKTVGHQPAVLLQPNLVIRDSSLKRRCKPDLSLVKNSID